MANPLLQLKALGQSVWYDNIDRSQLVSGQFKRLLDEDGICGVTANPTIFEKSISSGHAYHDLVHAISGRGTLPHDLVHAISGRGILPHDLVHAISGRGTLSPRPRPRVFGEGGALARPGTRHRGNALRSTPVLENG